ncbi:MAG: PEP/pyruvate-binding domain-containing protein, partial [Candidatus Nanohaloarchaea archaeon]
MSLVKGLEDLDAEDTSRVGGKAANLGELSRIGVPVLPGFTTTSDAYDLYMEETGLKGKLEEALEGLDADDVDELQETGEKIRELIKDAEMPDELRREIVEAYHELEERVDVDAVKVAVRSSATAEDLPEASFAGQQETFLNVEGEEDLVESVKKCFASLFTDRSISYREDRGFDHFDVKLSAVVQKMGRSDLASSGVMFTIDPDSGFDDVVVIEAGYGLGELVVQGEINPDEYVVFKETDGILEKVNGGKEKRMVLRGDVNTIESVPREERDEYALKEDQIEELAGYAEKIEEHYGKPMDIEWLLDGDLDELF